MKQMLAHYQLTPTNLTTAVTSAAPTTTTTTSIMAASTEDTVFNLICRAINCWFESNPQFHAAVHPRVRTKLLLILNQLDRADAIIIYRLPFAMGKAVYWPPCTRVWSRADWDGIIDDKVDPELRAALGLVAGGGSVPEEVIRAAGAVQSIPFRGVGMSPGDILPPPHHPRMPQPPPAYGPAPLAPMQTNTNISADQLSSPAGDLARLLASVQQVLRDDVTEATTASSAARLQEQIRTVQEQIALATTTTGSNDVDGAVQSRGRAFSSFAGPKVRFHSPQQVLHANNHNHNHNHDRRHSMRRAATAQALPSISPHESVSQVSANNTSGRTRTQRRRAMRRRLRHDG